MKNVKTGPIRPAKRRFRIPSPLYRRPHSAFLFWQTFRNHDRLAEVRDRQLLKYRLSVRRFERIYHSYRNPHKKPTLALAPYGCHMAPVVYCRPTAPYTARERRRKIRERQRLREHTRKRVLRRLLTHVYADIAVCRYLCDETLNRLLSVCSWEDAP